MDSDDWHCVQFEYISLDAQTVHLLCDFNGWNPLEMENVESGHWKISLRLMTGFCTFIFNISVTS